MRFAENFQVLFGKPLKIPLLHTDLFGCAGGRQVTSVYIVECLLYIYIYMVPPPPRPILSQNLLVFALFCCFLLCLNVCFFWRLFYMFKKLCRVVKTLPPLIKLFSFNRKGFLQNLEKTKKPKNQNFLEKFWFQVKRWFFLVFLEFFLVFFGLDS